MTQHAPRSLEPARPAQHARACVYAGSFDPFTLGHLEVVRRAAGLFDRVVVLIADNPAKTTLFSVPERVALAAQALAALPAVSVDATDGLVLDYARRIGAGHMVRGLRAADADAERTLCDINTALDPAITTVWLPTPAALGHISSTAAKAAARAGAAPVVLERLVPPGVARALSAALAGPPRDTQHGAQRVEQQEGDQP